MNKDMKLIMESWRKLLKEEEGPRPCGDNQAHTVCTLWPGVSPYPCEDFENEPTNMEIRKDFLSELEKHLHRVEGVERANLEKDIECLKKVVPAPEPKMRTGAIAPKMRTGGKTATSSGV